MTMRSMSTRESSREPMSLPLQLPLQLPLPPPRASVNSGMASCSLTTTTVTSSSPPIITAISNSNTNTNTTSTSCYITSIEDDHQAADESAAAVVVASRVGVGGDVAPSQVGTPGITSEQQQQQCTAVYGNVLQHPNHPNIRYYAVSMPWYSAHQQQQLLHQQILQHSSIQGGSPVHQLNISKANLRSAKASLKTPNHQQHQHPHHHLPLTLPQPLSTLIDPMSASTMMDCYSSYSEVIMELKSKFNSSSPNNKVKQKAEENV